MDFYFLPNSLMGLKEEAFSRRPLTGTPRTLSYSLSVNCNISLKVLDVLVILLENSDLQINLDVLTAFISN